jgi:RNA polymerase sigma-70 factor (ECF subfamily)
MCGYAKKYLSDLDQAEEIVQDIFFNFWSKRHNLQISTSLEAYLFRSVRNSCLNFLKHLKVREQYKLANEQSIKNEEKNVQDQVIALELQDKIDTCVEQLPPERKKIFKMSRYEGFKYREIADELGISIKTVEVQMGKALKFMREQLVDFLPVICVLFLWIIKMMNRG